MPEQLLARGRDEVTLHGGLVVEVSDTGIGIPADALSRIFLPFEQGDSSIHRHYGGHGLGLSIAHTLVKAHGGTLEAASEGLDEGAKFIARFQVHDSASKKATPVDLSRATNTDGSAPSAAERAAMQVAKVNGPITQRL